MQFCEVCLTSVTLGSLFSSPDFYQQALSSPITSELLVGALPVVPMDALTSPMASERETQAQTHAASGQDTHSVRSDQCAEASPLHSEPEDSPLLCSSPRIEDMGLTVSAVFSPPDASESSVAQSNAPQPCVEPQVLYQAPHQLQVSQALFAQNQVKIQLSFSKPLAQIHGSVPQIQVQSSVSQPQSSVHTSVQRSSPSPLHVSVSVPQQQLDLKAASASLSKGGDDSAVQQHTLNSEFNSVRILSDHCFLSASSSSSASVLLSEPTAALAVESKAFTLDVHSPSPAAQTLQAHGSSAPREGVPIQISQQTGTKVRLRF